MGSDGVFDNLFDDQIVRECIRSKIGTLGDISSAQDAATCITSLAEVLSYQKEHESPWTRAAVESGRKREKELGGKEDDITAIVA